MRPNDTGGDPVITPSRPLPEERCVTLSQTHVECNSISAASAHPLIAQARAVGYWAECFAEFERVVISHAHRALAELPNSALAARARLERECRTRLMRHLELLEGAL